MTRFIATKDGFSQSVENAFELSHLVRDGRVGLVSNNGVVVATTNIESSSNDRRKQCVLHLRDIDFKKLESILE